MLARMFVLKTVEPDERCFECKVSTGPVDGDPLTTAACANGHQLDHVSHLL
jgi:hypothetical protein